MVMLGSGLGNGLSVYPPSVLVGVCTAALSLSCRVLLVWLFGTTYPIQKVLPPVVLTASPDSVRHAKLLPTVFNEPLRVKVLLEFHSPIRIVILASVENEALRA